MPSELAEFWKSCWNNGPLPEPTEIPPADKYQREFSESFREKWPLWNTVLPSLQDQNKREVQQEKSSLNDVTVKISTQYGPTSMRNWRQEQKSIQRVLCSSQQLPHKDAHVLAIHCREEPISAPKWSISNGFHKRHVYLTTTRHCPGSQNNFPLATSNPCFVLTVEWVTNVKLSLWPSLSNWQLWKLERKQHYVKDIFV